MHRKKRPWIILLVLTIGIKVFSFFPQAVEYAYANGLYPVISRVLRVLFGWIPFSLGDILYFAAGLFLLVRLIRAITRVFRGQTHKAWWRNAAAATVFYTLMVYAVFNLFWGLNYNRVGIAEQLKLDMKPYSTGQLDTVMGRLLQKLDTLAAPSRSTRDNYLSNRNLFNSAGVAYTHAAPAFPMLQYHNRSVKASLYGILGNYLGYSGYYNPFTGEAQVNTHVPVFTLPFTTCHEMGHQLGYAKENEANFAGYLSAKSSSDPAFRYSVYYDLYNYGIRELYYRDSSAALAINKRKPGQVTQDNITVREFDAKYENPVEPYIRKLYGQYLRANQQPSGMKTYSEVMAFLIAYYEKYHDL